MDQNDGNHSDNSTLLNDSSNGEEKLAGFEDAKSILLKCLEEYSMISTRELKVLLEENEIEAVDGIISLLKYSVGDESERGWRHHGRSFYTPVAYEAQLSDERKAVESSTIVDGEPNNEYNEELPQLSTTEFCAPKRQHRQEEARMCGYVKSFLYDIYDSEHNPDVENIFQVHSKLSSGAYRNIDILAVDWRTSEHYELVSVEAKLAFNPQAVLQATNYLRFSHRVWLAIKIPSGTQQDAAGSYLKDMNRLLYEQVLDLGIGILACFSTRGRAYKIVPVQWPKLQRPTEIEMHNFKEAYRENLIDAGVLEKKRVRVRPAA